MNNSKVETMHYKYSSSHLKKKSMPFHIEWLLFYVVSPFENFSLSKIIEFEFEFAPHDMYNVKASRVV